MWLEGACSVLTSIAPEAAPKLTWCLVKALPESNLCGAGLLFFNGIFGCVENSGMTGTNHGFEYILSVDGTFAPSALSNYSRTEITTDNTLLPNKPS